MKHALPFFVLVALSCTAFAPINAHADTSLTSKTLVGTGFPIGKGPMAEFNGTTTLLYMSLDGTGGVRAFFTNSQGQQSSITLPSFPSLSNYGCGQYAMTSGADMWALFGTGPITAVHYKFSGTPLPTQATLVSSYTLGNSSSFCPSLVRLAGGALAGAWTQNNAYNSTTGSLGFAYLGTSGNWSQAALTVPYSTGGVRLALAQHPADGSIWAFTKQDGGQQISAYHLVVGPDGLAVDWSDANFISQATDGTNGPEGEFPYLVAVPDKAHDAILLAYQDNQYKFFSQDIKGAYVSIAQIHADRTKSFVVFPTFVERADYLALVAQPEAIYLGYFPVNSTSLSYDNAYVSSYNGTWSAPALLGTSYANPQGLAYGTNSTKFAAELSPNYQMYLFGSTPSASTSAYPSAPTSLTVRSISSSQINLAWKAPSQNGTLQVTGYMVERSQDAGLSWDIISSNTGTASTAFSDSGLDRHTTYTYRVSAINSAGAGPSSNYASATTKSSH